MNDKRFQTQFQRKHIESKIKFEETGECKFHDFVTKEKGSIFAKCSICGKEIELNKEIVI